MADLPTANSREVVASLKNQEALLENISKLLVKQNDMSSRKDATTDNKIIEKKEDTSLVKKLLSAFGGMGKSKLTSQEIQYKTLEETKVIRTTSQKMGLDIEFIRKSFEGEQKKKDKEAMAEALKNAVEGADGKSGIFTAVGLAILGGLTAGFKTVSGVVAKTFTSVVIPMLKGLMDAMLAIARFFSAGAFAGIVTKALGGAAAAMTPSQMGDGTMSPYIAEKRKFYQANPLELEKDAERYATERQFLHYYQDDKEAMAEYMDPSKDPYAVAGEYVSRRDKISRESGFFELNKELSDVGMRARDEYLMKFDLLDQQTADSRDELSKIQDSIKSIDTKGISDIMEEGDSKMGEFADGLKKFAEGLGLKDFKEAVTGLGTLKFSDGEVNLFTGAGGLFTDLFSDIEKAYNDAKEGAESAASPEGGAVNTQVNNTNIVNGNPPVYFPNSVPIENHGSFVNYLKSSGSIR